MVVHYLDTSVWVKRHVEEEGSASVHRLFESGESLVVSWLSWLEVNAAVRRRIRSDDQYARILESLEQERRQFLFIESLVSHADRALSLTREFRLRAPDALHLAIVALLKEQFEQTGDGLILWTSDRELFDAAVRMSISVMNPEEQEVWFVRRT